TAERVEGINRRPGSGRADFRRDNTMTGNNLGADRVRGGIQRWNRLAMVAGLVAAMGLTSVIAAAEVQVDGRTFRIPEGFTIERIAGPPLVDRPITAAFDDVGRLYVADSSGSNDNVRKQLAEKPHRIVRLEDTDGDGKFDKRT